MKKRVIGWLSVAGTILLIAAIARAQTAGGSPAATSAVPGAIDELWTMVKAAGVLGSAVLLITLRAKQKEVDELKVENKALVAKNEALHERYLQDAGKTREFVQELDSTVSTLVKAIASALAVGVRGA